MHPLVVLTFQETVTLEYFHWCFDPTQNDVVLELLAIFVVIVYQDFWF